MLKPSDRTPLSALIVGESLAKTKLPPGAFSILPCQPEDARHLVTDERVKGFSFTGSEKIGTHAHILLYYLFLISVFFSFFCNKGWQLHREAGRKKVVLELGGNAPCIIDETNKDRIDHIVKRLIFGAFYYSG